jgi:hypothetical protein
MQFGLLDSNDVSWKLFEKRSSFSGRNLGMGHFYMLEILNSHDPHILNSDIKCTNIICRDIDVFGDKTVSLNHIL